MAARTPHVVVVGSLNHDLAVRLPRLPMLDETLAAYDLSEFRGGKGFNQAVAAARLGAHVTMVGCLGDDGAGMLMRDGLAQAGVDDRFVTTVAAHTGTAIPLITDAGDVSIVIIPGANAAVTAESVGAAEAAFVGADVLLLQGEISTSASQQAIALARRHGTQVVLNPSPVGPDSAALCAQADLVIVNRVEATELDLISGDGVMVTLGSDGVDVAGTHVAAFTTTVVDPTGAGDAFTAAVAVAMAEGATPVDAARFGAAAGACAVSRLGAEPGLPTRAEVIAVLAR